MLNKTQKERDEIISERFTLEQELKVSKIICAQGLISKNCWIFNQFWFCGICIQWWIKCLFQNVKLDYELQTEKVQRLEKELHEISSAGNKDDKEVISLKRLKTELESKLQEQEEELDEQAGVIQQLEQVCVI